MDCSPVSVLLLILLILHIYQSVHTEKWQQTKQNNTSGSDYLLGGQAARTTIQSI